MTMCGAEAGAIFSTSWAAAAWVERGVRARRARMKKERRRDGETGRGEGMEVGAGERER
jgi:hypothetical protein